MGNSHSQKLMKALEKVVPDFEKQMKSVNSELFVDLAQPGFNYFYKTAKDKATESITTYNKEYISKELNIYKDDEEEEDNKKQIIARKNKDLNESLVAGLENPSTYIDWFRKEEPDEYLLLLTPEDAKSEGRKYTKASISYLLRFLHLKKEVQKEDFSFFKSVSQYFEAPSESAEGVNFALKIGLLFVGNNDFSNVKASKNMLKDLHMICQEISCLSLWGTGKDSLLLSFALDSIKETILKYLNHPVLGKDKEVVQKALQTLFHLGIGRGHIDDLFEVVLYCQEHNLTIDLRAQLKKLIKAKMPTEIGASEENIINRKQLVTKYKYEQMSIKNAYVHKDEPKTALCTDGAYLYLYSSIKGLFKLGTGSNSTIFGKIYAQSFGFKKDETKPSLFYFNKALYYTSDKLKNKLVKISIEDLTERETLDPAEKEDSFFKPGYTKWDNENKKVKSVIYSQRGNSLYSLSFSESTENKETILHEYDPTNDFKVKDSSILSCFHKPKYTNFLMGGGENLVIWNADGGSYKLIKNREVLEKESFKHFKTSACIYDPDNKHIFCIRYRGSSRGLVLYKLLPPSPLISEAENSEFEKTAKELREILMDNEIVGEGKKKKKETKESLEKYQTEVLIALRIIPDKKKESAKDHSKIDGLNIKQWTALFQTISKNGSNFLSQIKDITTMATDSKFLMSLYKYPLGIYLNPVNISALVRLLNIFYVNLFKTKEPKYLEYLTEAFYYLIMILRQHLNALNLLKLKFEDMKWDIQLLQKLFREIVYPFLLHKEYLKYSSNKLMYKIKEEFMELLIYGLKFLFDDENMIFVEALNHLKLLNSAEFDEDLTVVFIKALLIDSNLETLTTSIIFRSKEDVLEFLDYIMNIEIKHFRVMMKNLTFKEENEFKGQILKDMGSSLIIKLIEKIIFNYGKEELSTKNIERKQMQPLDLISGMFLNKFLEHYETHKKSALERLIFEDLLPLIVKNCVQLMEEHMNSFAELADVVIHDKINENEFTEENSLPLFLSHYWKGVQIVNNQVKLWQSINVILSNIPSLNIITEHYLQCAKELLTLADAFKRFTKMIEEFKEDNEFLLDLTKVYESEHPISERFEKDITVIFTECKSIKVKIDKKTQFPPSNVNKLRFYNSTNQNELMTFKGEENNSFKYNLEEAQAIGFDCKIEIEGKHEKYSYYGYKVSFTPKYESKGLELLEGKMRYIIWLICYCARRMYSELDEDKRSKSGGEKDKDKEENKKELETETATRMMLRSKLFSGGLAHQYFSIFDPQKMKKVKQILAGLDLNDQAKYFDIVNDGAKSTEEETLLNIMHKSNNQSIDRTIELLQYKFTKTTVWGKTGGEQADALVRGTFSVMIKHSNLTAEFEALCQDIEIEEDSIDDATETDILKSIEEVNKSFGDIYKKWVGASKMRIWLQEKKKDFGEKSQKDVTEDEELEKLMKATFQKMEFLIKLSPPPIWKESSKDSKTGKKIIRGETIRNKKIEDPLELASRRLSNWKDVSESKGFSSATASHSSEEISRSLTTSVLACLQSELTVGNLQTEVENIYIKSALHMGGMHIYNLVLRELKNEKLIVDVANWFSTTLRKNHKTCTGYGDFVYGSGDIIRGHMRNIFFQVINKFLSSLPIITKGDNLKIMLDSIKWQYSGTDHAIMLKSNFFKVIRSKDHPNSLLASQWGKTLESEDLEKDSLCKWVLDSFEFTFFRVISRALHELDNPSEEGSSQTLQLERYQSLLDENATEALFKQAFDIILQELNIAIQDYIQQKGMGLENYLRVQKYIKAKAEGKDLEEEDIGDDEEEEEDDEVEEEKEAEPGEEEAEEAATEDADVVSIASEPDEPAKHLGEAFKSDDEDDFREERTREEERTRMDEDKKAEEEKKEAVREKSKEETKSAVVEEEKKEEEVPEVKERVKEEEDIVEKSMGKTKKEYIDYRKEKANFDLMKESTYNPEFCHRLLRILYVVVTVAQKNATTNAMLPRLFGASTIKFLLQLLRIGFPSHKFLILKLLSFLIETNPDRIDDGVELLFKEDFALHDKVCDITNSKCLNYFIQFAKDIRTNLWKATPASEGNYNLSTIAIEMLRKLMKLPRYTSHFQDILKDILFNPSTSYSDPVLLDVLISALGGEFDNLSKGKEGNTKQGFATIIGFTKSKQEEEKKLPSVNSNLNYASHNRLIAYLHKSSFSHDIFNTTEIKMNEFRYDITDTDISIFKNIFKQEPINTIKLFQTFLKSEIKNPTGTKQIYLKLFTLKVKLLRIFLLLLEDNEISMEIVNRNEDLEGLVEDLLSLSNRGLEIPSSRSLYLTEQFLEYVRNKVTESVVSLDISDKIYLMPSNQYLIMNVTNRKTLATYKSVYDILKASNLNNIQMRKNYLMVKYPEIVAGCKLTEEESIVLISKKELLGLTPEQIGVIKEAKCLVTEGKLHLGNLLKDTPELDGIPIICLISKDYDALLKSDIEIEGVWENIHQDIALQAEKYGGFDREKVQKWADFSGSLSEILGELTKKDPKDAPEIKEEFDIQEHNDKLTELIESTKFSDLWKGGAKQENTDLKEEYFKQYEGMYLKQFTKLAGNYTWNYFSLLRDMQTFYWRHILIKLFKSDTEGKLLGIIEKQADTVTKFRRYMKIMMLEGAYEYYAFHKKTLKKTCSDLFSQTISRDLLKIDMMDELLFKELQKLAILNLTNAQLLGKCGNLFKSTEKQLLSTCCYDVTHDVMKQLLLADTNHFFDPKIFTNLINYSLINLICNQKPNEQYQIVNFLKDIMKEATRKFDNLSLGMLQCLFSNDLFSRVSERIASLDSGEDDDEGKHTVFKMMWCEIMMDCSILFDKSLAKFKDKIEGIYRFPKYVKDLRLSYEIMKEMPSLTCFKQYMWLKENKDVKKKMTQKLETPHCYYNTPCVSVIEDEASSLLQITVKDDADLMPADMLVIANNRKGINGVNVNANEAVKYKKSFVEKRLFTIFPAKSFEGYAFGVFSQGRLGVKKPEEGDDKVNYYNKPQPLKELAGIQIKKFDTGRNHALALDNDNNLYYTGEGYAKIGSDDTQIFKKYTNDKVSCFGTTEEASLWNTTGNTFYALGTNKERNLACYREEISNQYSITNPKSGEEMKTLSLSAKHSLLLYNSGEYYGSSIRNKKLFGKCSGDDERFLEIKTDENLEVVECLAVPTGSIIIAKNKSKEKRLEMLSVGEKGIFMGQGEKDDLETEYTRLDYPEELQFERVYGLTNHLAAVTKEGQLYMWGKNSKGQLGLEVIEDKPNEYSSPTLVPFFVDYKVVSVSMGLEHTIVLAEHKETPGSLQVFGMGESAKGQLGENIENKLQPGNIIHIKYFDGKHPYMAKCGYDCSFVFCGKKYTGIEFPVACHKTGVSPIMNCVIFGKEEEKYRYWSCAGAATDDTIPPICFATPNPVEQLTDKPWPVLNPLELLDMDKELKFICGKCGEESFMYGYWSATVRTQELLCEECFMRPSRSEYLPVIFYRLTRPIKVGALAPLINIDNIYSKTDKFGFTLNVLPKYQYAIPHSVLQKNKDSFTKYSAQLDGFTHSQDFELLDLMNNWMRTNDKEIKDVKFEDMEIKYKTKSGLKDVAEKNLKKRAHMWLLFNKFIYKILPYLNLSEDPSKKKAAKESGIKLLDLYVKIKEYILYCIKFNIQKKGIEALDGNSDRPEVKFNRLKARKFVESGMVDHTGEKTVFGQLFQKTKDNIKIYNKNDPQNYPFRAVFQGEGAYDAGGVFREAIDHLCTELESEALPILIKTPNNKNSFGLNREKWIINPSSTTPIHHELFEFFGVLIGMSIRSSHLLALNLPAWFWKQILGDPLESQDLKGIDCYCYQCIEDIINIDKQGINEETFKTVMDEKFVTRLSDGMEVEICQGGFNIQVIFQNRQEYVDKIYKTRYTEGDKQMKSIRNGVFKIVPSHLVKIYSWRDLEYKVCGKPEIDVEALKKITNYSGCNEDDQLIKNFWKVFEEFTTDERQMYLRFVWGRSRLPIYTGNDSNFQHKITIKESGTPDGTLPEGHTCFFQVDIPRYTTAEIMKEKILYAITFCQVIDTDNEDFETWEEE